MASVARGSRTRKWIGRVAAVCAVLLLVAGTSFSILAVATAGRYDVPLRAAAESVAEEISLAVIAGAVAVYDPVRPRPAPLGPADASDGDLAGYSRIEEALADAARSGAAPPGGVQLIEARNERIVRSPWVFRYQPYDEPRLHELRRKYALGELVAAGSEFEGMVRLRHWVRTRFRRQDYQPFMKNFDALAVLDRNYRDHGEPYTPAKHFDPCHFFPLLYIQTLASVGHHARLVSTNHGMTEVWSNQHRKWVLMDAELDQHVEKDGVPLNMLELSKESPDDVTRLRLVRSARAPHEENPTVPHLGVEQLSVGRVVAMFDGTLEVTELRNDWMSNWYFPGHPARSEKSSLIFVRSADARPGFWRRLRPYTANEQDVYWTLNQSEILMQAGNGPRLQLAFRTVTPNWASFEVVLDGETRREIRGSRFEWTLHPGINRLSVRAVNAFGVRGPASEVTLSYGPEEL